MRDGTVGGGNLGWDPGPYPDGHGPYDTQVPGPRLDDPWAAVPDGGGYGGQGGYGAPAAPGGHESHPGYEGYPSDPSNPSGPHHPAGHTEADSGRGNDIGDGGDGDGNGNGDAVPAGTEAAGSGGGHRRSGPRRRPKSRKRKVLKWVSIVAAVAVLGSAGAAYGYYEYLSSKIRKGERASGTTTVAKPKANAAGQTAMNILIIGSDTRTDPEDAKLGGAKNAEGARADVIMIAHLSADRSNMSVVSIPRDTRVDIPDCEDPKTHQKFGKTNDIINASLGRGGPGCTLATVQNLTDLYIDHWLMIDFAGVVSMADVLGGVEVCVNQPVEDHPTAAAPGSSHLLLKKKGTQVVEGKMALAWLRARHPFFDDAGRSKAQHMYMTSLIRSLRTQNYFTNPAKLNKVATTAMNAFEVSEEIGTPKKLYDLGMQLKTIPPDRITMLTMPRIADPKDPNAHYLPKPVDAEAVWTSVRNDVAMDPNGKPVAPVPGAPTPTPTPTAPQGPPAAAPATVPVTVVNGTAGSADGQATSHRATNIKDKLVAAGFTKAIAATKQAPSLGTGVKYPQSGGGQAKSDALSVAKALKIPAGNVKPSTAVDTITLTVGADWKTGTDFSATLPKSGSVPISADAINGADKGCMDVYAPYVYHG